MLALVEAAAVEGKADRLHDLDVQQPALAGALNLPVERQQRLLLLQLDRLADQRRQAPRQRLEHRIDVGGSDPGREFVHQRVVGREIERLAEQRRLVAHQRDHFLEVRREQFELVLLRAPRATAPRHARWPWPGGRSVSTGVAIA